MASDQTKLDVRRRESSNSRETRRLRRSGRVPGVLYGLGRESIAFDVDERELRHALHAHGAVLELDLEGSGEPAVLKETQRHPVRGDIMHVDLIRVNLNRPIEAQVPVHIVGLEDSPGVREGGVLEHPVREVTVEALPTSIPEFLEAVVSGLEIHGHLTASEIVLPEGVSLVSDADELVASVSPPRLQAEVDEDIEGETEVVGEADAVEPGAEGDADSGDSADE
ncbi:MAG TPA: 50S ribosomal protein L25 [Baekduia sp.]|nr:50S ribosomal protein L25 [Baekduia sp.]